MSTQRLVHGSSRDVIDAVRGWLDSMAAPEPLVVETSGSTGRPKRVQLSRAAMTASANATHARLGGPGQWLLPLPASYVAGLQVVVRSLLAGHEPVVLDDHASFADAAAATTAAGHRYTSLVPTQLHRLIEDSASVEALAGLDAVLLGGGPIDPALRSTAEGHGIRVVATYGSSETAGGCVYDGVPLDGVEVAIDERQRIRIGGPTLFDGYLDEPELTAETLVDGWFITSDVGRLTEGRLEVLGRVDDVVITGGVNVPAPAVARRLRAHPDVAGVEVVGVADAEWGHRVVACVVGALARDAARDWVAEALPRSWAPRQVVTLEAIPLLGNGKVDRMQLARLAEEEG
ncbi:MAG: o-succinylbenzoate--CoA ligase [Nocardioides sp.]|nr:o-succinylbenzoate--CoA ligase [Nocardioides sp.]